jgi:hypothetical protein
MPHSFNTTVTITVYLKENGNKKKLCNKIKYLAMAGFVLHYKGATQFGKAVNYINYGNKFL